MPKTIEVYQHFSLGTVEEADQGVVRVITIIDYSRAAGLRLDGLDDRALVVGPRDGL
jgi:hypothetical protein